MALPTAATIKPLIGVSHSDDDAMIDGLVRAAAEALGAYCGRPLISTAHAAIPFDGGDWIILGCTPIRSSSISIRDTYDNLSTVAHTANLSTGIVFHGATGRPDVFPPGDARYLVDYTSGLDAEDGSSLPDDVVQAIALTVRKELEAPSGVSSIAEAGLTVAPQAVALPPIARQIAQKYRRYG